MLYNIYNGVVVEGVGWLCKYRVLLMKGAEMITILFLLASLGF